MESIGLYIEKIERISRGMSYLVFGSQLIKVKGVLQINYTVFLHIDLCSTSCVIVFVSACGCVRQSINVNLRRKAIIKANV